MNVIITLFGAVKEVAANIINHFPLDQCHIVGVDPSDDLKSSYRIPDRTTLIGYDYWDMRCCIYQNANWDEIRPLDEAILEKMAPYEGEILEMMERDAYIINQSDTIRSQKRGFGEVADNFRINKYCKDVLDYHERKRIYLRHLRYWSDFFERNHLDLILICTVPHVTHYLIMYYVSRLNDIPCVMMGHTPVAGYKVLFYDYKENNVAVGETYKRLMEEDFEENEFPPAFQAEWDRLTAQTDKQTKPWYTFKEKFGTVKFKEVPNEVDHENSMSISRFWDIDYWHFRLKGLNRPTNVEKRLFDFYEANCSPPDNDKTFIYVPLHFQPENTTSPLGGVYANQLLMIELLAANLPENYLLYVKENPNQTWVNRHIQFYLDLLAIPQVRLISRKVNTFSLIDNCVATATVTGTAGWEGLFKGKPFIMFGDYVVKFAPGVYRVNTNEECKEALRAIDEGQKPQLSELRIFMKALEKESVHAYKFGYEQGETDLTEEENIKNLSEGFIGMVEKLNLPVNS